MSSPSPRRTGRRPGPTDTRERIAAAARSLFAEQGYERTTFRGIASAAGVDPALVVHFYGAKAELFRQVMQLPEAVSDALLAVARGPREEVGRRPAQIVLAAAENPATQPVVLGRIRSATSHPEAAALVRETVTRDLARLTVALAGDRAEQRAVLVGAHFVGI